MSYQQGNIRINPDGTVDVVISADGLPSFEALVPAPMVSEAERERKVDEAIDSGYMGGWLLTASKRIKNGAFDKGAQRTTTQLSFRTCKTTDEAEFVCLKVKALVER